MYNVYELFKKILVYISFTEKSYFLKKKLPMEKYLKYFLKFKPYKMPKKYFINKIICK